MIPFYWSMNRNIEIYGPDAHHFNPARFLDGNGQIASAPPDTKEEGHITFGFGRRTCIGTRVAKESMFISIAVMLWAMNIECAIDQEGNPVPLDVVDCIEDGLAV
jgi:cytochrome P450